LNFYIRKLKLDNHLRGTPIFHGSTHTKEMKEDFKLLCCVGISNKWTSWPEKERQRKQKFDKWKTSWKDIQAQSFPSHPNTFK